MIKDFRSHKTVIIIADRFLAKELDSRLMSVRPSACESASAVVIKHSLELDGKETGRKYNKAKLRIRRGYLKED